MEEYKAEFEHFLKRHKVMFSDPEYMRGFLDFLQQNHYPPTDYARMVVLRLLETGAFKHVGVFKESGMAYGITEDCVFSKKNVYYADEGENVDVMELLTQ